MSIVRAPRPEANFYVLSKSISEDARLSWAARGLLVYLLGKPDNWKISVESLRRQTEGARVRTGRDGIYALLSELEQAGYLSREQQRGEGGRVREVDYTVCEYPSSAPLPARPDTAQPLPAPPYTANPTQTRTDTKQELSGAKPPRPEAGQDQPAEDVDTRTAPEVIRDAYNDLLGHRSGCIACRAMNPKFTRRLQQVDKDARKACADNGMEYEPEEFWRLYFTECLKDPWMRGDRPNPRNARWKQSLKTLVDDERFLQIVNVLLAAAEGEVQE